ncbi:hypothetical protein [Amycolatopsis regifaucium]|uniref:Uncharacterized protein n=1 Tax=Amycolatopsis regifaucium TaxID=546365 RepID=A0A154MPS6_9PSEU|nr:hypothetical protein [Amycolatopsis regifaucium]KZB86276.1 hypothetical protein AVL48_29400 [Amycolatopsis regifaucium]OKA05168.1 hypothetical protein ATP06_0229495 [Amycolatopsis regifaucium]SFH84391.1 hypothetical protein SAMN04489731_106455 [Amycolatopsis regifaucium]
MGRIFTSVGALVVAGMLTAGPVTPASAATGPLYITQNGLTTTYTNPSARACISSDPATGDATFYNRTDTVGYLFNATKCTPETFTQRYLRRGERTTLPPGYSVVFP